MPVRQCLKSCAKAEALRLVLAASWACIAVLKVLDHAEGFSWLERFAAAVDAGVASLILVRRTSRVGIAASFGWAACLVIANALPPGAMPEDLRECRCLGSLAVDQAGRQVIAAGLLLGSAFAWTSRSSVHERIEPLGAGAHED
jgi:hypothetical protein